MRSITHYYLEACGNRKMQNSLPRQSDRVIKFGIAEKLLKGTFKSNITTVFAGLCRAVGRESDC